MKQVYLDNAATTPIRDEVIEVIADVMKNKFGNASSSHSFGRSSKALIEKSRKRIAGFLNVSAGEIVFTSGGTEANNLILRSAVRDLGIKHIVSSRIEHHAVLHTLWQLEKEYGVKASYVDLLANGNIDFAHLESLLQTSDKTLVSLMHINNEIGNILDLKHVSDLCQANGALFHSDAVQSIGHYELDLQDIKLDFLSASAHKFHGPKGVGFAFVRKNSGLKALVFGGEQERGLRGGTESTHNIVGMETALAISIGNLEKERAYIADLKRYFIDSLTKAFPSVSFNGRSGIIDESAYTLVNVRLPIIPLKVDMLLFQLDLKGIACSKGSACQSGSSQKSHVLAELLSEEDLQKPSIRFSFSIYNTKEEIDYVIDVLKSLAKT